MLNFLKRKSSSPPILKYLAQVEGMRAGAIPTMKAEEFNSIRDDVQKIVQEHLPSRTNGRLPDMVAALQEFFAKSGIDSEAYLTEVWIRGGRKAMDNYNGRQINSAL